jgi:hypothetical protein
MAEEPKNKVQDESEEALADLNPDDADDVLGGVMDIDPDNDLLAP